MAINKHSITISYCSQVFWISNQNLDTGYFDSFHLSDDLWALTTIFVHVFLGCEFFSVFFCSEGDNTGELKMCLNSEVFSNPPKLAILLNPEMEVLEYSKCYQMWKRVMENPAGLYMAVQE